MVLNISYNYDFLLFGIVSGVRAHKLAWWLNKELGITFIQEHEVNLYPQDSIKKCWLSNFSFNEELYNFNLIKNKSVEFFKDSKPYLLSELKEYDYFLKFGGESEIYTEEYILKALKFVPNITFLRLINVDDLKQKENLLII